jgi:hypothetical protein
MDVVAVNVVLGCRMEGNTVMWRYICFTVIECFGRIPIVEEYNIWRIDCGICSKR